MAQSFFPITPVVVTPGTTGSWQDMDLSSHIPVGATGAIFHIVNTGSYLAIGLRKNGSTDNRYANMNINGHTWIAVGVDGSRIAEAYVGNTASQTIYCVGYTMSGVTFLTNAIQKTAVSGGWQDLDCSSQAPSAVGLIFEYGGTGYQGIRKNGSTDDRRPYNVGHRRFGFIIGCDGSQICEGFKANTMEFWLLGYITTGVYFNTNGNDISLGSTGSWIDLSALSSARVMGFIAVFDIIHYNPEFGLRKNGSSENILRDGYYGSFGIIECDTNQIIEGQIESTDIDFFLIGEAELAVSGWTGIVYKVTDPEKVFKVAKADIAKVFGVE